MVGGAGRGGHADNRTFSRHRIGKLQIFSLNFKHKSSEDILVFSVWCVKFALDIWTRTLKWGNNKTNMEWNHAYSQLKYKLSVDNLDVQSIQGLNPLPNFIF